MKRIIALTLLAAVGSVQTFGQETTGSTSVTNSSVAEMGGTTYQTTYQDAKGKFGAGLIVGEPTGLSAKYFLTESVAIDGAFGWAFRDETDLHLHGDILWHKFDLFDVSGGSLPLYFGVGGRVKFIDNRDDRAGIRFPVGVSYMFDNIPVDIFAEVAPIIDFTPETRGGITGGIGARYWFW